MPRPRCLTCDGVEFVIEYRLKWKTRREGEPPGEQWRRLKDMAEGVERIGELGPEEFDPEIVSAARRCPNCNKAPVAEGFEKVAAIQDEKAEGKKEPDETPVRDWKMAQAGDL